MRPTLILLSLCASIAAFSRPAAAQLTVFQPGFDVQVLPSFIGARQIECSPGGVWGNYVYVADTLGGVVERIDPAGVVTPFAINFLNPTGLEFGPGPGGNFGDFLYVVDNSYLAIYRVDPSGAVSNFAGVAVPYAARFDPTGAFGTDLFVSKPSIHTLSPSAGIPVKFASVGAHYMKFGPGGAWGTELYSSHFQNIDRTDAAGVVTPFVTGFTWAQGFDWGFGGDLFAADRNSGSIYRIAPSGAMLFWGSTPYAADVAFCNDALYVVSFTGECYKVTKGVTPYCTAGTSASGCQARLSTAGTPSASAGAGFVVTAANVEGGGDGIYFFGANGRQAGPWGNGTSFRCVAPPVKRAGRLAGAGTTGSCNGSFVQDLNVLWAANPFKNPGSGAVVQAQLWYLDPQNTAKRGTSLSDAIEFVVAP